MCNIIAEHYSNIGQHHGFVVMMSEIDTETRNPFTARCVDSERNCEQMDERIYTCLSKHATYRSIGVARILSGVHFFPQKIDDLFSLCPQKTLQNYTK